MYSAPSSSFQACRAAEESHETNTISVFAFRKDSRFSWRSRASSSHTAVKANGMEDEQDVRAAEIVGQAHAALVGLLEVELGRPLTRR